MEEKIFFMPGDLVQLRQGLPNKPTMYVVKKETKMVKLDKNSDLEDFFIGIRCRWFRTDGGLEEAVFNTKDLIKL